MNTAFVQMHKVLKTRHFGRIAEAAHKYTGIQVPRSFYIKKITYNARIHFQLWDQRSIANIHSQLSDFMTTPMAELGQHNDEMGTRSTRKFIIYQQSSFFFLIEHYQRSSFQQANWRKCTVCRTMNQIE